MKWADIAFRPDDQTAKETADEWRWLVDEPWRPLVCSMFGGLFLEKQDGVFWLECPTGEINRVADDAASFDAFMSGPRNAHWSERIDNWFLPPFVEVLHQAGKLPGPEQCYGFMKLPVFKGGTYTVENTFLTPRREWLTYTGSMHRQLRDTPDGGQVRVVVK